MLIQINPTHNHPPTVKLFFFKISLRLFNCTKSLYFSFEKNIFFRTGASFSFESDSKSISCLTGSTGGGETGGVEGIGNRINGPEALVSACNLMIAYSNFFIVFFSFNEFLIRLLST